MDDMERYGDYNEVDEAPTKSPVLRIIKAVALIICFSIIGIIGFRMFTFNYYPRESKTLFFTDGLTAHYNAAGGDISILTQELQSPYDDAKEGNLFCDHLRVVREAGYLQVTLRFNNSFETTLLENYKADVELSDESLFSFRLCRDGSEEGVEIGALVHVEWQEFLMYRYAKLVFEDIDFGSGEDAIRWIRLETKLDGVTYTDKDDKLVKDKIFMNLIYEDHDTYSKFTEYKPSREEAPR